MKEAVEHCGGEIGKHRELWDYLLKKKGITGGGTEDDKTKADVESKEAYEAVAFLCGLNGERYQGLLDELANAFLNGRDEYPKTVVDAYNLVSNWKGSSKSQKLPTTDGMAFNTNANNEHINTNTTDGVVLKRDGEPVKCFTCQGNHCPHG